MKFSLFVHIESCVAGSRLIVERAVKDAFLNRLKDKAEEVRIGSPLDMPTRDGPTPHRPRARGE